MLTVLLLSPRAGLDPPNGDVTYTEQLLAHPPDGVHYVPYDEALRAGSLQERYRRRRGESGVGAIRRESDVFRFLREAAVNRTRAAGYLFREPFRHFVTQPGAFDAVHVHVYSVRVDRPATVPLVVSNSIGIDALYRDGFGMAATAVDRRRRLDTWLAKRCGVTHSAYGHEGADAVVCFSDHLRQAFLAGDHNPDADYIVVPPGVSPGEDPAPRDGVPLHTGFIGDWRAKGGDTVLAAHRALVERGVSARLTVVGSDPRLGPQESSDLGITWLPRLSQEVLLQEVVPTFTAFAYPSRFDGLPLTLLEVMARGVPVVVSDYGALPEVVQEGRAGMIVKQDDAAALAEALVTLSEADARQRYARAARRLVCEKYAISQVAAALGGLYHRLVDRERRVAGGGPP